MKKKKITALLISVCLLTVFCCITAYADGDVAGAVQSTWYSAKSQIKSIPVIDVVLAILLFAKLSLAYMDYRKHGQFEWTAPAIIFGCLLFSLTAPLYVWSIVGM